MTIRSPYPDVEIPDVTLTDYVLRRAGELGDKPALVDGPSGRTLTFAALAEAVQRTAAGLAARGFGRGDVLGIYSPNLPEYAVAFLAVAALGGVNTTTNPLYTAEELANQLRDAGARYLVTVGPFLEKAQAAAQAAGVEEVFTFDGAPGSTPFSALAAPGEPPRPPIDPASDVVVLPYSSGTTGLPKGVMLTHRNLVANVRQLEGDPDAKHMNEHERVIGVLPFFHIYGMVVIMCYSLANGATVVTVPRFELESFLQVMQEHRITYAYLVPPIVLALAKHPAVAKYDLSALTGIMSGAAPLGEAVAQEAADRLGCPVLQGYGLTETSPVTHISPIDPAKIRRASIGLTLPNTEARVVDIVSGRDAAPGEEGELWIRGPQVMKGYHNNPAATRAALDAEGWFHTGDVARADADGYFYVVDRLKELIKYKGAQVAPAELEALLVSHPAVADAAVVPSPDDEAGEVPKAYVVTRETVGADELMAWVAERVSPTKRIRRLEFIDAVPKSASGKILRRVLVERERQQSAGA